MPLHGNYRKSQLMDNRVVLASFQHGEYCMAHLLVVNLEFLMTVWWIAWFDIRTWHKFGCWNRLSFKNYFSYTHCKFCCMLVSCTPCEQAFSPHGIELLCFVPQIKLWFEQQEHSKWKNTLQLLHSLSSLRKEMFISTSHFHQALKTLAASCSLFILMLYSKVVIWKDD